MAGIGRTAWMDEFFGLHRFGMRFGVEAMERLCDALGKPQRDLRFLHLAGTNGKGSTASMLAAILASAGFRIGLYTSPHLISFGERIQVDGRPLPDSEVERWIGELRPIWRAIAKESPATQPTFFDVATALALLVFREAKVDWVLWETGMGGRLDSTNIVRPELAAITPISFDHMRWLGSTLEEIAAEKAGILKPGVPAVSAPQQPPAAAVLQARASEIGCDLRFAEPAEGIVQSPAGQTIRWAGNPYELRLLGAHQWTNAGLALECIQALRRSGVAIPESAVQAGLRTVSWPARAQWLRPEPPILLDGAHNESGAAAIADLWRSLFPSGPRQLIFASLQEKDYPSVIRLLAPHFERVATVPIPGHPFADPDELARVFRQVRPEIDATALHSIDAAIDAARRSKIPTLIAGSLYLAGEILSRWELPTR